MELGPLNIRVNSIAPGRIHTVRAERLLRATAAEQETSPDAILSDLVKALPSSRVGTIEDIADAVLFLVSERATDIKGAALVVDGSKSVVIYYWIAASTRCMMGVTQVSSNSRSPDVIYMVELNFSDPAREDEWNAWYETYLAQLVSLPGLSTAQRFRAVTSDIRPWDYLALYSLTSLDVFESDAYRKMGGGGNASARFKDAIRRRRNVYMGIERVPAVTDSGRLLLCEDAPNGFDLDDCLFVPLEAAAGRQQAGATELDGEPASRAMGIIGAETANSHRLRATEGLAVFAPITKRYV